MAISEQQQMMNMEKFKAAQEKARKLISSDARTEKNEGRKPKYVPTLSESISGNLNGKSRNFDTYEEDIEEPQMLSEAQMQEIHNAAKQMPIQQSNARNSKLPSAILNSMKSNPIDTSLLEKKLGMESQSSVLDTLGIKPNVTKTNQKQRIVEQQTSIQTQPSVDYSLIKTIIEESVKKYVGSLKKTMLNENKEQINDVALMRLGETFKFVTKNGDIFEARLKKIGNINEKKQ